MPKSDGAAQATGARVREHLLRALTADLVGPFDSDAPEPEQLTLPPSRWYLTGFLAPEEVRDVADDPTADDDQGAGDDRDDDDASAEEPMPKQRKVFPASLGLSVLLPEGEGSAIEVTLRWAEYECQEIEPVPEIDGPDRKRKVKVWTRGTPREEAFRVPLDAERLLAGIHVPNTDGIWIVGKLATAQSQGLAAGTRALSLFVVNRRSVPDHKRADEGFLFQVELELGFSHGFVPRPNRANEASSDFDDRVADLQFRNHFEHAVGHGVAAEVAERDAEGGVTCVRTRWIPRAEVRRVKTHDESGVELGMDALARLGPGEDARAKLGRLIKAYGVWLEGQATIELDSQRRRDTRDELVARARRAQERIERGIERLGNDAEVRRAFCLANEAMANAARARFGPNAQPRWRMFQLAFVLLNLTGIADPEDDHRDDVELIFFPTGGGKTEAYLGVIGFALLLRRLRGGQRPHGGLGVAVLLRYTLRLLTLDQLGRAATLVCALELLRQRLTSELGEVRFAVGLWVGKTATANTLSRVSRETTEYKNNRGPSPFPLTECPWCKTPIRPDSMTLFPKATKPEEIRVSCVNPDCDFSGRKTKGDGLPVLFVDEQIYRELPAFLVATVDKFAMLPWRGETGMLFGRVTSRDGRRFSGPLDGAPKKAATKLPDGLQPPELIVQDELHLISGPLGTMVGLYETAIERLATRVEGDRRVRPKILASTATVRRSGKQIQALFGRPHTNLFPPPGVDTMQTWFARLDDDDPGRLYVGVAASGRAMKAILLRTYVSLLGAAAHQHDPKGHPKQPADAYMTVAGYFNSLRELGGMRRLVEDDVRTRCAQAEARRPRNAFGLHPWVRQRRILEPVELTSREKTSTIAKSKARLNLAYTDAEHIDVLLASNMISVGVDIDRLGLMVVAGQPKTTSEYIQASSRVGRQEDWPGLVVTCFNIHKPRDRSHYEHFVTYHESFYRYVEATSLTPFSAPAVERGHAGVLAALVRLGHPTMTPAHGVMALPEHRSFAESMNEVIAARAGAQPTLVHGESEEVDRLKDLGLNLLDAWTQVVTRARQEAAAQRAYSPYDRPRATGKTLLRTALDAQADPSLDSDEVKFVAPTSMRDVEGTVHLWVERLQLGGRR